MHVLRLDVSQTLALCLVHIIHFFSGNQNSLDRQSLLDIIHSPFNMVVGGYSFQLHRISDGEVGIKTIAVKPLRSKQRCGDT